jgi:hypothetical protein
MSLRARVDAVRDLPPLSTAGADALRELDAAVAEATSFDDLPGKWQAAILEAETSRGEPPHEA